MFLQNKKTFIHQKAWSWSTLLVKNMERIQQKPLPLSPSDNQTQKRQETRYVPTPARSNLLSLVGSYCWKQSGTSSPKHRKKQKTSPSLAFCSKWISFQVLLSTHAIIIYKRPHHLKNEKPSLAKGTQPGFNPNKSTQQMQVSKSQSWPFRRYPHLCHRQWE